MSRITAFKNKINRLEEKNKDLEVANITRESIILKHRKDLKILRDTVIDQNIKIIEHEESSTFQFLVTKEKEIILLKQEGQCKQIDIDSLVDKLYRANKGLSEANETISKLHNYIKMLDDKKIKNRLKKMFIG
ncbi:hypothetical protein [Clostridium sp.]|jgi:hypothetical protein|uniref:hypothetical protein n=1 Tax=Clostridium sp. TaxID=1506 RepID=UPI003EEDD9A8